MLASDIEIIPGLDGEPVGGDEGGGGGGDL